jgi:hypothetical protein
MPPMDGGGFLPQLDEFLFYNSWKENCGKLQMNSSSANFMNDNFMNDN